MASKLAIRGGEAVFPEGPPGWPPNDPEIRSSLEEAWRSGDWGRYDGPFSERLRHAIAALHDDAGVYLCSSGTVAVELALRGVGISAGDEIALAGYDFPGNFRAIEAIGARPLLVDIRNRTWCLDPESLASAVGPDTKAVLVSHLHGGLADMKTIADVAQRHGLAVVEDVCQAPAARFQGRTAGTWGDVAVWSFGGSKLLTAGRGGAIISRREDIIQRVKVFSERGNQAFPLSELQAAVLEHQVKCLLHRNAHRERAVRRLLERCGTIRSLIPLAIDAESSPAFYKLGWLFDPAECTREQFAQAARAEGIALDEGFRGFVNRTDKRCRKAGPLPQCRLAATATLLLHHPVLLESLETIDKVGTALAKVASAFGQLNHRDARDA